MDPTPTSARLRLLRAVHLRCPHCGGGPIFRRWLLMPPACPSCKLKLDRGEDDYFLGGYLVNFVGAEIAIVVLGFAAILLTWPDVPWGWIGWGLGALMILFPVITYPFSKLLWLAMDVGFRPVTPGDFEAPRLSHPTPPG